MTRTGILTRSVLLPALLLLGCAGSPPAAGTPEKGGPPTPAKIARHETYLKNPTLIEGDSAHVILPDSYGPDLTVRGLSSGWVVDGAKRRWIGSGACELELFSLRITSRELSVTLVTTEEEPEVSISAVGRVNFAHSVRGVGSGARGVELLTIKNERSLYR